MTITGTQLLFFATGEIAALFSFMTLMTLIKGHYLKTGLNHRRFFIGVCISIILIGIWSMIKFTIGYLRIHIFGSFLQQPLVLTVGVSLILIGIAWFFGRRSAKIQTDMMGLRHRLNFTD
jgi:hypothetical protein